VTILPRVDNTVAISYINRLGGCHSDSLHEIAKRICKWCEARKLWLVASYNRSKCHVEADFESRREISGTEWLLGKSYFLQIQSRLGCPTLDLFASSYAHQRNRYISWQQDPGSESVDAFCCSWSTEFFYAFPPFNLVARVLKKVRQDRAREMVVVPLWTSQSWYPQFREMCISDMIILGPNKTLITCPFSGRSHPLHRSLKLAAAVVSGLPSQRKGFQAKQ
jgi:hypothetical protein